jgi:hypothetical protein
MLVLTKLKPLNPILIELTIILARGQRPPLVFLKL